jgi:N-acetylglucosamine kinase-like BadF-type ATPase
MAVAEAVYTGQIEERQLLQLAPTVFRAAADGDQVARLLIDELAREVVTYVTATVRRLDVSSLEVPVILGGGLFRSGDARFLDRIRDGVLAVAPRAQLRVLQSPPVLGAALLGLAELGAGRPAEDRLAAALSQARLAEPVAPAAPVGGRVSLPAREAAP